MSRVWGGGGFWGSGFALVEKLPAAESKRLHFVILMLQEIPKP